MVLRMRLMHFKTVYLVVPEHDGRTLIYPQDTMEVQKY